MKKLLLLGLVVCSLTACTAKSTIFRAPDETQVSQRKDLTLPPDYTLRPPKDDAKEAEKK
ncbi:MAG: DUF3035 domain-containing protein [Alphaproteobacteria bacterium]|nr:DUF3035 domain-containing protein [Alphaproteobacteria bacterium]